MLMKLFSQRLRLQVKPGHVSDTDADGYADTDIFAIFDEKRSSHSSQPGLDYIAFRWDPSNNELFPTDAEQLVLGEAKYTSSLQSIAPPIQRINTWIRSLGLRKVYQELVHIASEYQLRGEESKSRKARGSGGFRIGYC